MCRVESFIITLTVYSLTHKNRKDLTDYGKMLKFSFIVFFAFHLQDVILEKFNHVSK